MKGLILSGGHGTRLRPITYTVQKQLIPIANKPIIFYAIEDLVNAGIKDIGIIVGPNKEQVKATVGNGVRWGEDVSITFIEQDFPGGLAHCVMIAKNFLGNDKFVMYLGDNMLKGGITKFVEQFKSSDAAINLMLTRVPNPEIYGVALIDEQKKVITRLLEKPKNPPTNLSIVGVYGFTKDIFLAMNHIKPSWRNELEITDAMQWLLENGFKSEYFEVNGWWKDTGTASSLLAANALVLDDQIKIKDGTKENLINGNWQGRIRIGDGCDISDECVLQGPMVIGNGTKIGKNVYIGPYTSIGNNVSIYKGEISNSIIMDGVVIDTEKRIINSVIGRGARVTSKGKVPSGNIFVIGDNSSVEIG
ncbi:MAG: glucose-1-phosphate thymidylyltransferase [Candidatus Woesearchaeota archaeon]